MRHLSVQVACNAVEKRSAVGVCDAVAELQQIVRHRGVAGWHTLDSAGIHLGDLQHEERR